MTAFRDHFGAVSDAYARHRPRYPEALFAFLASVAPARDLAWDCGTGNGQAALGLAEHFRRVVATDASAGQLARARPHPRVEYRRAPADASGLPDRSTDLVTAAQALHWFDLPRFYAEARRVLVAGGVLAVWCYGLLAAGPELDPALRRFYEDTVGPYWPPERRLVDAGYRSLDFPFEEIPAPALAMETAMTLDDLGGFLSSWSATRYYRERRGHDPVPPLLAELAPAWGPGARRIRWPLAVRAGRVPA